MVWIYPYDSPLGGITLASSDGERLSGLWFDGQKYYADTIGKEREEKLLPVFRETMKWLDIYFSGREPLFTPPLLLNATPFRREVWDILLSIPYGKTMTYGEIAARIAFRRGNARMSAQAVGGAVGHNPVSLIIPCHRVVGTDGNLTGYAGGISRKVSLLALERVDMSGLYIPEKKSIVSAEDLMKR